MSTKFDALLEKLQNSSMKKVAVACAQDEPVLEAVRAARERKIADAILVGDEAKIRQIAASIQMDLSDFTIINDHRVMFNRQFFPSRIAIISHKRTKITKLIIEL